MKIHNIEQGSPEWHELRKGKLTASHGQEISANGAGLITYVKKIILAHFIEEKALTGHDIERGNTLEPIAREKYCFENNVEVEEVGFIEYTSRSGYSPDGLVGKDGLIEIKARNDKLHFDLLVTDKIDTKTVWQMQMGMLVTGRKWCDFISYNPNFKKNSMYVQRVERNDTAIAKLQVGIDSGTIMIEDLLTKEFVKEEINNL